MSSRKAARRRALAAAALCAATVLALPRTSHADLTWDPNGPSPGAGGSGDWNTTSPSWFTGTSHTTWDNVTPQLAIFGPASGTLTLTSPITATSGLRFDVNGYLIQSDTLTLGGTLSGTGSAAISSTIAGNGFTLVSSGFFTLTGSNTYTGPTFINNGILIPGHANALGSTADSTTITNGQVRLTSSMTLAESFVLSGAGFGGVGTIRNSGAASALTGNVHIGANTVIDVLTNATLSISNGITGSAGFSKIGAGTLVLDGAGSYTGNTSLNAGTTVVRNSSALGTSAIGTVMAFGAQLRLGNNVAVAGESLSLQINTTVHSEDGNNSWSGPWIINGDSTTNVATTTTFTLGGTVSGPARLIKSGLGELLLTATNFHGGNNFSQGPVTVTSINGLGAGSLQMDGGTNPTLLKVQANQSVGSLSAADGAVDSEIRLANNSSFTVNQTTNNTFFGSITGTGTFTKSGVASLTLMSTTNSHDQTIINGGTLFIAGDGSLGDAGSDVQFGGGTLATTAAVTSTRTLALTAASGAFDSGSFNSSFGPVTGVGNLIKSGTGRLTVPTLRNSMGDISVQSGTLAVAPDGGQAGTSVVGTLTVSPSAALDLNDNDLVVNAGLFTEIQAMVLAGFGNTAGGITSSTSDGSQILALFDNTLISASDWNGLTIEPNAIVGKYTYFGDANFDGQVTGDDYTVIDANLDSDPITGIEWLSGDMNLDGVVTGDDYTVIDANLGLGTGNPLTPSLAPSRNSITAVPEPAAAVSMLVLAPILLRRARRDHRHAGPTPREAG